MYVSYKWLQDYVDLTGISPEELAEKITRTGIEVEDVEKKGEKLKKIVVGHVLTCEDHPNSDHLHLCQVDIGEEEPVQIVCGAPNVAAGQKVIVAKAGARIAGNVKIKKGKIRGEVSHGMICSLQELGFDGKVVPKEYADGIFVLPEDAEVGADALSLLNLDDAVLELSITANRADCMSMLGVAYETAAIFGKEVKLPEATVSETNEQARDYISVRVESEDSPIYTAKVIKNVKIGPSPLWLQNKLMAAGIRPHNNVVDITNYVLLEYGQPLHAFDYDRFGSKEVLVRKAYEGEKMVTLDGTERTLRQEDLVITNGKEPVALAGVMGGLDSEVKDDTTTILLESAYFNGTSIRRTSRYHGLRSEASSRFERGIDPTRVRQASERAAALIAELAGGEVLEGTVAHEELRVEPVTVQVDRTKINRFLGTDLSIKEVEDMIQKLQFEYTLDNETFVVHIPSRRWDISIPEDMYEEIARIYGYDKIPTTLPVGAQTLGHLTPYQQKRRVVREVLEGAGLLQATTYSLTSKEKFGQFALQPAEPVQLSMPMSEEHAILRDTLIPHLLDSISYNRARKNSDVGLYEIGKVFYGKGAHVQPEEVEHLAVALTGLYVNHPWQGEKVPVDFYTVKGILEALFERLQLAGIRYEKAEIDGMHPGQTAKIYVNDEVVGFLGKVHPTREKEYDVKNVFVFELDLEKLINMKSPFLSYTTIPKFPGITRDIALVVDQTQTAGELKDIIVSAGGKLLKEVNVFDVYVGDKVPENKKSVAFTLKYSDPERTLTDDEVNQVHENVVAALQSAGAELRM
ncbi:phenylalanine--tRNA ligase subunit beta [Pallidibacillus thermolactis]|jgi:phenylalanyl-tRNA synthetase beta chain|uniref:phenylalanine--tRNA ligase subunit beta n=1 Tax=Pallidibacillus thermolactis TaxID=251051 RepID=UPI00156AB829|nr:phenylalanine--tRNA ligase subunit beta [Pallidibacillus thermolactis]MCU9601264.1 phenylalanine--tRNA ligase subunit beta [Pallidibacillus thermolactis subsp. kokeshiiformis]